MKKLFNLFIGGVITGSVVSCVDHDDPHLAPIDTTQVRITASVTEHPTDAWMDVTEEMTVGVSDIELSAPKGVMLKSVSLIASGGSSSYVVGEKPYSGEPMEFKVPLKELKGRINFSLRGNLVKKDSRDAEVIIADNIQKIVFSETPKFECEGWLYLSVKSVSTSGEEYSHSFELRSTDKGTIEVPEDELYWTPSDGTAETIEISFGSGATAWSPNTTFVSAIPKTTIGHSSGDEATLKVKIANSPGALNALKLQEYVICNYSGTWEGVTISPVNMTYCYDIIEVK